MTKKRIHLIYGAVLSLSLIVAGICLIGACLQIYQGVYRTDAGLYSRAAVAAAFAPIAIPVYISLALLIGSFLLQIFLPVETAKKPAEKQYDVILQHLHRKLDAQSCDPALYSAILAQQKKRKIHTVAASALLAVCSIIFLIYGLNMANYPFPDATGAVRKAMWLFLPCLAVPFGYAVFAAYAKKSSVIKEIGLVKQAIAEGGAAAKPQAEPPAKSYAKPQAVARYAILCAAVGLLIFGFAAGGTADVLTKAINICTECVGLG